MIHEQKANGRSYLIVQVPKDANGFYLNSGNGYIDICYWVESAQDESLESIEEYAEGTMPSADYTFLFVAEQAHWLEIKKTLPNMGFTDFVNMMIEIGTLPDWQQYNHVILLKEQI